MTTRWWKSGVGILAVGAAVVTVAQERGPVELASQGSLSDLPAVDLSEDGRYVAFESSDALVPQDTNRLGDVYLLDRVTQRVSLESVGVNGVPANGTSREPRLSADGRLLVFSSDASNIVADDTNAPADVFLRDRAGGATRRVSQSRAGVGGRGRSNHPDISADGRIVVFASTAKNLLDEPVPRRLSIDIYVLMVETGRLDRLITGADPVVESRLAPAVNGDGTVVAFVASGSNRVRTLRNPLGRWYDVHVWDGRSQRERVISAAERGGRGNGWSGQPRVSADGQFVAFTSWATNLGVQDENDAADVYLRDLATDHVTLVSRTRRGKTANATSSWPALSLDGRFVVFQSDASNLACEKRCAAAETDRNAVSDVYLLDRQTGRMRCLSRETEEEWWAPSLAPAIDARGFSVAFSSRHSRREDVIPLGFALFVWSIRTADGSATADPRLPSEAITTRPSRWAR